MQTMGGHPIPSTPEPHSFCLRLHFEQMPRNCLIQSIAVDIHVVDLRLENDPLQGKHQSAGNLIPILNPTSLARSSACPMPVPVCFSIAIPIPISNSISRLLQYPPPIFAIILTTNLNVAQPQLWPWFQPQT